MCNVGYNLIKIIKKRINNQLERFRVRLSQGLAAVDEMQRWYKSVDINKLNIHLLSS